MVRSRRRKGGLRHPSQVTDPVGYIRWSDLGRRAAMHNVRIKVAQRMWVSFRLFMKRPGGEVGMGEMTRMEG